MATYIKRGGSTYKKTKTASGGTRVTKVSSSSSKSKSSSSKSKSSSSSKTTYFTRGGVDYKKTTTGGTTRVTKVTSSSTKSKSNTPPLSTPSSTSGVGSFDPATNTYTDPQGNKSTMIESRVPYGTQIQSTETATAQVAQAAAESRARKSRKSYSIDQPQSVDPNLVKDKSLKVTQRDTEGRAIAIEDTQREMSIGSKGGEYFD